MIKGLLLTDREIEMAYVKGIIGKSGVTATKSGIKSINKEQCKKMYEKQTGICKVHKVKGKELGVCRIDCVQCNKELRKFLGIES